MIRPKPRTAKFLALPNIRCDDDSPYDATLLAECKSLVSEGGAMKSHITLRGSLRGAAMLTAVPVIAMGVVPVFDIMEFPHPVPLHPVAERIITGARWLGVEPLALTTTRRA